MIVISSNVHKIVKLKSPSIYTGRGTSFDDCSHWCLAGVPDAWNEILYAVLFGNY